MAYDKIPTVDEKFQFPPQILNALGSDTRAPFMAKAPTVLGSENLNDLRVSGYYAQNTGSTPDATLNYPVNKRGLLTVVSTAGTAKSWQTYQTDSYGGWQIYSRVYESGSWGPWIDTGSMVKDGVPNGQDMNLLTEPGIYTSPSNTNAQSLINYPSLYPGTIHVLKTPSFGMTTQYVSTVGRTTDVPELFIRTIRTGDPSITASWTPWYNLEHIKGEIRGTGSDPYDVDTLNISGIWAVRARSLTKNLPGSGIGYLEVLVYRHGSNGIQKYTEIVSGSKVVEWYRYAASRATFAGSEWIRNSDSASSGGKPSIDHGTRVDLGATRRGGSIGTGGKAVFALRFDHWLDGFKKDVLPLIRKYNIPCSLTLNYERLSDSANGGGNIPWSEIQTWNQYDGIEITNHGLTHKDQTTADAIYEEIVTNRRKMEEAMPKVCIETWQENGSSRYVASDIPGDTGLANATSMSDFTESYAGRLLLQEHAVISGKAGGYFQPLNGRPQLGFNTYPWDRLTLDTVKTAVGYAQRTKKSVSGYMHPGILGKVSTGSGYLDPVYNSNGSVVFEGTTYPTTAALRTAMEAKGWGLLTTLTELDAIFAWLSNERNAGRLMIMTAAGAAYADSNHSRRENLISSPGFQSTLDWNQRTGWLISSPGPNVLYTATDTAKPLTQHIDLWANFGWAHGAVHEFLVNASAEQASSITLTLTDNSNASNWSHTKTFSIPGDNTVRPYRMNFALPRDRTTNVMRMEISGTKLKVHGEPLIAAI